MPLTNIKDVSFILFSLVNFFYIPCAIFPLVRQSKLHFPTSHIFTKQIFDLIHVDTLGPYKTQTYNGHSFFLTMVDDFSRGTWTFLLNFKFNAFTVLKSFLTIMERQFKTKVKIVRFDNAFELVKELFIQVILFYKIFNIKLFVFPSHNKMNQWTESTNVYQKYLGIFYISPIFPLNIGECLFFSTYLINKFPSRVLHNKTPFEIFFNTKSNYSSLKCFGCLHFTFTLPTERIKFDSRVITCVFLGYPHGKKGYKVMSLDILKFFVSRDVIFHEECFSFPSVMFVASYFF